ncbi:nucleotidyltransferase [Lacticaseibacillus kribbianus]|uniref:nucleotidyltransferase n=1 Tax=Lacticaseibacillus kribbianus TaxID=2926292 RepID=UPI001CD33C11|nr:nucleotidyltransferase [Lacticaseibacillus kribbianus]
MKAVGMIAEFNPLHNGHVHALAEARRKAAADVVVVVMAGNFVQRGEPAIVDKWARAQAALASGADLVVELPVFDAVQAADEFATGGVALLAALGVSALAFGTEDPDLDYAALAERLAAAPPDSAHFRDFTQTYATQLNRYFEAVAGVTTTAPNLMLGLSYAQASRALDAPLTLLPFQRRGADHDAAAAAGATASGSAVRRAVAAGEPVAALVPPATAAALAAGPLMSWAPLFPLLRHRLQTADLAELRCVTTMAEGLEYRFTQQIDGAADFADFLARVKSKRYTNARLRRLALCTLLNLTDDLVAAGRAHRYLHVLGFTPAGQAYLHEVKKQVGLPLITRVSADMLAPGGLMAAEHRADRVIGTLTHTTQDYGRVPLRGAAQGGYHA